MTAPSGSRGAAVFGRLVLVGGERAELQPVAGQQRQGQHGHRHHHDGGHRDRHGAAADAGRGRAAGSRASGGRTAGCRCPASSVRLVRVGGAPGRAGAARWAAGRRPSGPPGRGRRPRRRRVRSTPARRAGPAPGRASPRGRESPAMASAAARRAALAPGWRARRAAGALAPGSRPRRRGLAGPGRPGVRPRAMRRSARRSGAGGQLRGGAPLPLDAGFGPEPVRALPRGKAGAIGTRALGAWLAGTGGLEARAACAAVARLGRAQAPARRLRRQRGGPGSVRLAGGRGYGAGVRARSGSGWRGQALAPGQGLVGAAGAGLRFGGSSRSGLGARRSGPGALVRAGASGSAGWRSGPGRGRSPGGRAGGDWAACRNHPAGGATPGQELLRSAGGSAAAGCGSGSEGQGPGPEGRVVGIRLARARDHQARRHGPGGHEVFRIIPAEQAGTLPLFLPRVLRRGTDITIPTRLVTFCTHHRPQSRHTFPANTAVRRSSHFLVQTG